MSPEQTKVALARVGIIKIIESTGILGDFTFRHHNYYWVVEGKVPMSVAIWLFSHPVGKEIRVDGDCGCPNPEERGRHFSGKKQVLKRAYWDSEFEICKKLSKTASSVIKDWEENFLPVDNILDYPAFITSYHIDSELALYIFIQKIKECGLDKAEV